MPGFVAFRPDLDPPGFPRPQSITPDRMRSRGRYRATQRVRTRRPTPDRARSPAAAAPNKGRGWTEARPEGARAAGARLRVRKEPVLVRRWTGGRPRDFSR